MLPQMTGYVKCFESNKTMSCKVRDKRLLKSTLKYGEKISSLIGKKFDSEPVYDDSGGNINTNFQGKKIPKELIESH